MKYIGMPFAMWLLFEKSFERNLTAVFGITKADAKSIMAKAKAQYKEIIENLPEFEKGDRFQMNIVGCAMLAAVHLILCGNALLPVATITAIAAIKREWRVINNAFYRSILRVGIDA